ncbi:MAG: serine/threonine-protein phosphatase [Firmicutes bacterium]|nr:serine/threonine-protein phosphatase [Bacillota bacterium]
MRMQGTVWTDQGNFRPSNQDSCLLKIADTAQGTVCLAAVCDGMGGLEKGELASAEAIRALDEWFCTQLPALLAQGLPEQTLMEQWNRIIWQVNGRLRDFGERSALQLGTTVTAMLIAKGMLYLMQVGDCRAYLLTGLRADLLTQDQTMAFREFLAGHISAEQLRDDPRQSYLTQCVGVGMPEPEFLMHVCPAEGSFLLCSDGFYHKLYLQELQELGALERISDIGAYLGLLGQACRQRGEKDNMTAVVVRCFTAQDSETVSFRQEDTISLRADYVTVHTEERL